MFKVRRSNGHRALALKLVFKDGKETDLDGQDQMEVVGALSKKGCQIEVRSILNCIFNLKMRKLRLASANQQTNTILPKSHR